MPNIFQGLFDSEAVNVSVSDFLLCIVASLVMGVFIALIYTYKSQYSKGFIITTALLPAVVCVVIMMVNGNLGAGVAVAGVFNLVRFRSVPGTAKEIGTVFIAMGAGLISGMGYLGYAGLFTLVLGLAMLLFNVIGLGESRKPSLEKSLRITVPEDLNYTEVFDDILAEYTKRDRLVEVKTTNLGSLFRLTYNVTLKDASKEKEFIDALRCRNGNLEIRMAKQENNGNEL